ncbi:hypothetical protein PBY51_011360 [Eleginops maclovinus]|uniref:Mixed lineage kinase domain-containing protein n=1 Tax=Eleginops maclovinus TaxID=56733 RepID=A0AAN8AL85_ELEMC|nr:hypothetical protein PBY51_011360 [Eleginops maclovinus]
MNPGKHGVHVLEALTNLQQVLEEAERRIKKFKNSNFMMKLLRSIFNQTEFHDLNDRLSDAFERLSADLHVLQIKRLEKQRKCVIL